MGIYAMVSKPWAAYEVKKQNQWAKNAPQAQEDTLREIVLGGCGTRFGNDHHFGDIGSYESFKRNVPIRDYEELKPYIELILQGGKDVLWKGKPLYFAKTSGTTSGTKYIPITKDSMPNHIDSARNTLFNYIVNSGNTDFTGRNTMMLSGSPVLSQNAGINTGRLSGIVNHHVPAYLNRNKKPSYATNCIEDWEEKLDRIVDETLKADMSLISGIPPWVQMYFDKIQEKTGGKPIKDVFPNFSLFVYGGVNFAPYKDKLFAAIGKPVDSIETYPASEGFFAYQDTLENEKGMLLLAKSGIFYEFIPVEEYFSPNPRRLCLAEVEAGKNYALIVNSNAGLWGYSIGDTVKFVSTNPYRLVVTGRIKHFISAFGEHVIGEEVEQAMSYALAIHPETAITEFSVAPNVAPATGLPHHEWLVAFSRLPNDMASFANDIDDKLRKLNSYYDDLVKGSITSQLKITALEPEAFQKYMKTEGKLGGQNKVPRLSNDRKIADRIAEWQIK